MKVEMDVLGSPFLIVRTVTVGVKPHWKMVMWGFMSSDVGLTCYGQTVTHWRKNFADFIWMLEGFQTSCMSVCMVS